MILECPLILILEGVLLSLQSSLHFFKLCICQYSIKRYNSGFVVVFSNVWGWYCATPETDQLLSFLTCAGTDICSTQVSQSALSAHLGALYKPYFVICSVLLLKQMQRCEVTWSELSWGRYVIRVVTPPAPQTYGAHLTFLPPAHSYKYHIYYSSFQPSHYQLIILLF